MGKDATCHDTWLPPHCASGTFECINLLQAVALEHLNSHDPEGMLTGLVPPCHSRHEPSVSDGPSSRCQLLTGILLPPLDECTGRRLRFLVQAFKVTSHNDLAVPERCHSSAQCRSVTSPCRSSTLRTRFAWSPH